LNNRVKAGRKSFASDKVQQGQYRWWGQLKERRGGRARLRRCRNPSEVLLQKEFFRYYKFLGEPGHLNRKKLATVCGLLSHVEEKATGGKLGGLLGKSGEGSQRPKISEHRFRRLLNYENQNELYRPMIRIIRQLDGKLPVREFSKKVYYWDPEGTREDLAFNYYQTIPLD